MKEDELKKIIKKSELKTSDDFINTLMHSIETSREAKKESIWWSFKPVMIVCTILLLLITMALFKLLSNENSFINSLMDVPKIPIFTLVTIFLLVYINSLIRLNELKK